MIRLRRNTGVETAVEIDDDVDAVRHDAVPAGEIAGDEQPAVIVNGEELHLLPYETFERKYSSVVTRPCSSGTFGSHPSLVRASVMSGLRCLGSSCGSGW